MAESDKAAAAAPAERDPRRQPRGASTLSQVAVHVGNLPEAAEGLNLEGLVSERFSPIGTVRKIRVAKNGRHATVTYTEAASAQQALTLNGADFMGNPLLVEAKLVRPKAPRKKQPRKAKEAAAAQETAAPAAESKSQPAAPAAEPAAEPIQADPKTVWIKLPPGTTEDALKAAFGTHGSVTEVRVARNQRSALVTFETEESAEAAVGTGVVLEGNNHDVAKQRAREPRPPRAKGRAAREPAAAAAAEPAAKEKPAKERQPRAPREPNPLQVYVGNLPRDVTAEKLGEIFPGTTKINLRSKFGPRRNKEEPQTQYAVLTYPDAAQAQAASQANVANTLGPEVIVSMKK